MIEYKKTLMTVLVIIFLIFSGMAASASHSKIWKHRLKEFWFNYSLYVDDEELQKNNTYEKLRNFFNGCDTPGEFYHRIQQYVNESLDVNDYDLSMNEFRLPIIVDTITDNNATLYCQQQTFLFAAGIKAMYSHYDDQLGRCVLNDGCGDFKIEIWRSFDLNPPILPFRSHVQIVVDKWNGTDSFLINDKTVDKLETDTWENEYRAFNKRNDCLFYPFFPAKLNSILFTKNEIL
jgi:hypothetical protein